MTDSSRLHPSRRHFGALAMGGTAFALAPTGLRAQLASGGSTRPGPVLRSLVPQDGLPRSMPEAEGVSSEQILHFLDDVAAAGLEFHGWMMARHGKVIAEGWWWPYGPNRQHMCHSLTKSFNVTAVGMAMDAGKFGYDDKLVSFFKGQVPADASDNLKAITVRDLLDMTCGHDHETSGSAWRPLNTSWAAEFFKIPVPYKPGTHFQYTSAASYMLSGIVTKTTGLSVERYLRPRFFEPLGITNYHWDISPEGFNPGGNGLSCTTADSLKLGLLYEQKGVWKGQRLLSDTFIAQASQRHSHLEGRDDAYGYQWWLGEGNVFYGNGLFTQYSMVFPDHGAVMAFFSAIDGSEHLRPYIWKHFPAAFGQPTAPTAATGALREKLAGLRLLPVLQKSHSPIAAKVSGKSFKVRPSDQNVQEVSFTFRGDQVEYRMIDQRGTHRIVSGLADWVEQDTTMTGARIHHEYAPDSMRVVAGAEWRDAATLVMTWCFVESAFRDTVICKFSDNGVTIDRSVNMNMEPEDRVLPTLSGALSPSTT
jgi:CubicO group peptidase (beta-lactamase class C family)